MATSHPYVFAVPKTAAEIPSLTFQGAAAQVVDQTGRPWTWNGVAYALGGSGGGSSAQPSLDPPSDVLPPTVDAVVAGFVEQTTELNDVRAQLAGANQTIATYGQTLTAMQAAIAALQGAVAPGGTGAPTNSVTPVIVGGGPLTAGSSYTITPGTWSGAGSAPRQYQLLMGSVVVVPTFTGVTFTCPASAAGGQVRVIETVSSAAGTQASISSINYSVNALAAYPTMLSAPTITGTLASGNTVTGNHGTYNSATTIASYTPYKFYVGGVVVQSGSSNTLLLIPAYDGLTIEFEELPTNTAGAIRTPAKSPSYNISGGGRPFINAGDPGPGWEDGIFAVDQDLIFNFGEWSANPDPSKDIAGLMRNGSTVAGAVVTLLGDGRAKYRAVALDQGTQLVGTILRANNNGSARDGIARTGGRLIGQSVGGGGTPPPVGATGVLSATTATLLSSYALASVGTRNWWSRDGSGILNQKSGGENVTIAALGAGMQNDTTSPSATALAWASGGTPNASGNNQVASVACGKATVWANSGAGESYSHLADTTTRTLHLFVSVYNCTAQFAPSLGDSSASMSPITVTAGGTSVNYDVQVTFKGDATTALLVAMTNLTATGNIHIYGGYTV